MLTRLEIRNFQSLKNVELDLGEFTVIVGPSSSGKSALIRACKALASNVRGSGVITRGQKAMAVTAHVDHRTVTLERTETSGTYRVCDGQGSELTYTKLNGGVPDAVTAALGIAPVPANGTSINFASQFDKPYLLDDTGANVARALGELTNVNTIIEAVRTANKIRLRAASTLSTRRTDLTALQAKLKDYEGLAERLKALEQAETLAAHADTVEQRADRLQKALMTLTLAEKAQAKASTLPDVPSPDTMNALLNKVLDLTAKINGLQAKTERVTLMKRLVELRENEYTTASEDLIHLLGDTGVCPTCGQVVERA